MLGHVAGKNFNHSYGTDPNGGVDGVLMPVGASREALVVPQGGTACLAEAFRLLGGAACSECQHRQDSKEMEGVKR